jgi:hypothetical protein
MLWVDGSTLISVRLNNDQGQPELIWVNREPVNGYMFNLCIEAGICAADWLIPDSPAGTAAVLPEHQQAYCEWAAGGRALNPGELTQVLDNGLVPVSVLDNGFIPASVLDNGFIPNEASMEFRCAVENPTPQPSFCQTAAFYGNGLPEEMGESATRAGEFCQNGEGYVTFDLILPENAALDSTSSDCQRVNDTRIACTGNANGSSSEAWVQILCDMMGPEFGCRTGFELNSEAGAVCSFTGEGLSSSGAQHLAILKQVPLLDPPPGGCAIGYYYDSTSGECIAGGAPGASPSTECVQGFERDANQNCCASNLASGNYPGCPVGVALDPASGACDFERTWVNNSSALEVIELDVITSACTNNGSPQNPGRGGGGGDQGGGTKACSDYVDDASCKAAGCSWNGAKCS